jgi:hypothetical protein
VERARAGTNAIGTAIAPTTRPGLRAPSTSTRSCSAGRARPRRSTTPTPAADRRHRPHRRLPRTSPRTASPSRRARAGVEGRLRLDLQEHDMRLRARMATASPRRPTRARSSPRAGPARSRGPASWALRGARDPARRRPADAALRRAAIASRSGPADEAVRRAHRRAPRPAAARSSQLTLLGRDARCSRSTGRAPSCARGWRRSSRCCARTRRA